MQIPMGQYNSKQHGISEQTIYTWRRHFGSMDSADVKRLREIEQENARPKKMVADRDLEIDVMKQIAAKIVSAQARREPFRFGACVARVVDKCRKSGPENVSSSRPRVSSTEPGQVWAYDFVHDAQRQWPAAQMRDRHGRVYQGEPRY